MNPKGYRITGKTTTNKIVVDPGVTTELTFDSVSITNLSRSENCVTVSHANVTITLIGDNVLSCEKQDYGALIKDGMDDTKLTLQCEYAGKKGHKCSEETCGSLKAGGVAVHVSGIGSSIVNRNYENETGFSNLEIKGGIITAQAGEHNCAIGAACCSYWEKGGYTKNIVISGGVVRAIGGSYCAGIGSGSWTPTDGVYITGGTVYASGGKDSPGIGSGGNKVVASSGGVAKLDVSNIVISGGDTVVTAVGDKASNVPGIGCGNPPTNFPEGVAVNITASPNSGYQGYIQDGISEDEYNFTDETPFALETPISVEKYYTKIYFGPYRDENTIEKNTKEQIGANHVISKTGGNGFTEDQLKELTKVNGKQADGSSFPLEDLTFKDPDQIEKINQAKKEGKIGEYSLTYLTPSKTEVTVTVYLRDSGTDAAGFEPDNPIPTIGANDFEKDTGGDAFTEEQMKKYAEVQGKDEDGNTISLNDFVLDAEQFEKINEAKTAGRHGVFDLTYTAQKEDKEIVKVTVKVSLMGYDEVTENADKKETLKGMNIVSKTGGEAFTESQLKDLSKVKVFDENGHVVEEQVSFQNPEQIVLINEAKKAGETGDFSLTFQTEKGTEVTVVVFLREEGTDGAKEEPSKPEPSVAASNASHKTGGEGFTEEELINLCKAKGKDETRNNAEVNINKAQMEKLNVAKQAGRTGTFDLTFFVEGGKEAKVIITLTGDHRVSFNPNGGDYTPKTQTVSGGKSAVEPKEPKREGYTFKGWYYKDENGIDQLWDFETPVHMSMELKAKWEKEPEEIISTETVQKTEGTSPKKKQDGFYWKSEDITKSYGSSRAVAKTGDAKDIFLLCAFMAASGGLLYLNYRKYKS